MATDRWDADRAWAWYRDKPWICGCNYVPSNAVNTTEFWQAETFDPVLIARELGWAASIGLNSCRVFLQYLVWAAAPVEFLARMDTFLGLAQRNGLSTMFCLFDDCAFSGKQPYLGQQDSPTPGVHNSCWTPSPGHARVTDRAAWPDLEHYVHSVVGRFAADERVLAWDLYNEPGNSHMNTKSLPLARAAFDWARAAGPTQPLTTGLWLAEYAELNHAMLELSDIVTFHCYGDLAALEGQITTLRAYGRPVMCTEWMARHLGSLIATHLPVLHREGVGCYQWGLVRGKTQTHFPWGSPQGAPEPEMWFHNIFHEDGRPYREEEIALIREYTAR